MTSSASSRWRLCLSVVVTVVCLAGCVYVCHRQCLSFSFCCQPTRVAATAAAIDYYNTVADVATVATGTTIAVAATRSLGGSIRRSFGRSVVCSLARDDSRGVRLGVPSRPVPSRLVPSRLRPAAIVPPPLPPIGYVVPARNSAPARFARPSVSVLRSRRRRPVIVATIIIIIVTGSVATAAVVGPWK